ncbi:PadR family transcriptional regulator [Bacillus niameyensis]|uniref:PadR family transcriptional regulator n=1 Tax=Bacillus niameyensis TaxID=1522308 RepID=UPI000782078D|nr:PadR family transcriptional regulator [Bacillus niameyensis]
MKKRRGFVQIAILHLLKEEAMHGYQIMKELEERSSGAYSASAGTVYPALQELLDQHLIELDAESDKKIYVLSDKGKKRVEEAAAHFEVEFWVEWKERMVWRNSKHAIQLKEAVDRWEKEWRKSVKKARGNPKKIQELITMMEEMTDRLKKDSNS